jgi:hypothetical protein
MIPIMFGAGILLGSLELSSGSLIPCMIGHTIMDIGLFGYWWTGIAGEFTLRPIGDTLAWTGLSSSRASLHALCLRSRCWRYGGSAACVSTCSRLAFTYVPERLVGLGLGNDEFIPEERRRGWTHKSWRG